MTTDAPRPDDALQSDAPHQDQPVTTSTETVSETTAGPEVITVPDPATVPSESVAPDSSTVPEAPETPDSPEDAVGDTLPVPENTAPAEAVAAPAEAATNEAAADASQSAPEASTAAADAIASAADTDQSGATEAAAGDGTVEKESAKIQMQGAADGVPVASTGEVATPETDEKVEIPRNDDLDANLEAELEAALAGESTPPPPVSPNEVKAETGTNAELTPGQKTTGTISSIAGDNIIIDLGVRTAGVLPARQFAKQQPEVGQKVDVVVDSINEEEGTAAVSLPGGSRKPAGNWDAVSVGQVVDALVKKTNKGGLEVMIGGLRGFMPASQVDLGFVSDLDQFVGQKLTAKILEVNPQRRKLVVSKRALLAEERKEKEGELFKQLEKGKTVTGKVKSIKDFGAFVDLGGADGLLHIGQISWSRINHPSDVLEVGQEVEVQILDVDVEKKKISLSMRQLQANPWSLAEQTYPVGSPVTGTVSRVTDFGAFVKLEPGVEGLIHISQLDHKRVRAVSDVVREGQEVEAKVMEVNTGRRRISLSLKAMMASPTPDPDMMEMPQEDDRRRRRKNRGDLRGGTGGGGRGGLFGDPSDFG